MSSLLRFNAASTARNRPLTGDTKSSFVLDDHLGWLKCDGRALDKVTFNLLFQVIGYQFGQVGDMFKLPNLQGRVMGNTGFVSDQNNHTYTFAPGESVGELDHKLTVNEMPIHNHDDSTSPVVPNPGVKPDGNTSTSVTGITHNGTGPTGGGRDGYGLAYQNGLQTMNAAVNDGDEPNLFTSIAALTLTDSGHKHTIASNGNDEYHNNIQPTLFYGNTFIYSGVPITKNHAFLFPFTTGRNPVLI